jgi:lysyl-tRNA synthetase class 2
MSEESTRPDSIREVRLEKLAKMRELGHDPYAIEKWERTDSAQGLLDGFEEGKEISFAGRIVSYRQMGKAGFAHMSDGDAKIQGYFRRDDLQGDGWALYNLLDIGDHVGVRGRMFLTKTGEKSIHVDVLEPLSKALISVPIGKVREIKDESGNVVDREAWYELEDVEARYRHRHLDLIANPDARKMLIERAKITAAVRRYFDSQGYLEVETPLLQVEAGGAAARPFHTHYNHYKMDVKLRISLELYLKRLICGDIPRVYEIGRVFRNEGISNRHSPEFTMIEFYEAYANLETMMMRMEECFKFVCESVYGTTQVAHRTLTSAEKEEVLALPDAKKYHYYFKMLDFGQPWQRVDLLTAIENQTGLSHADLSDIETALRRARELNVPDKAKSLGGWIDLDKEDNLGGFIEKLLEVFVEPTLQDPSFVVGYPIETSPLAKKDPNRPGFTRRFEGYVLGREICNAFSEINDPVDQRERFEDQLDQAKKGNDEAHGMDEDFIYALESGMPPTGGCGFGIDRMAMLLTGADVIREVLFFPMMKPLHEADNG